MSVAPLALDSPRFFDDEPLSAWSEAVHGRAVEGGTLEVASSKRNFDAAKAFAHSNLPGSPFPGDEGRESKIESAADVPDPVAPHIGIELVRGANGPSDDDWTVLIDGIRCPISTTASGVKRCRLPGGVARVPLDENTLVRPVVIGVRLESEALMPVTVEVSLKQVLKSKERRARPDDKDEVTDIGGKVLLKPYRVTDVVANAVTMPYPYWAPAQSALGILSYKPIKRWNERKGAILAHNVWANFRNAAEFAAYVARDNAYSSTLLSDSVKQSFAPSTARARKPVRPRAINYKGYPARPKESETHTTFIIGGKDKSAAKELADLFKKLTVAFLAIPNDAETSMQTTLKNMRLANMIQGETPALALFDALLVATPFTATKVLLDLHFQRPTNETDSNTEILIDARDALFSNFRRKYVVEGCEASDSNDSTDTKTFKIAEKDIPKFGTLNPEASELLRERQLASLEDEYNRLKDGHEPPDYAFTYARMPIEIRQKTIVHNVICVKAVDFDGAEFNIEFESSEEDGIVAHAVYSKYYKDVLDLDEASIDLVDCLIGNYMKRDADQMKKDNYNQYKKDVLTKIFGKNPRRVLNLDEYSMFLNIGQMVKHITWDKGEKEAKKLIESEQFQIDPCNFEERVAELRLMAREVLPIWPPVERDDPGTFFTDTRCEGLQAQVPTAPASPPSPAAPTSVDISDSLPILAMDSSVPRLPKPDPIATWTQEDVDYWREEKIEADRCEEVKQKREKVQEDAKAEATKRQEEEEENDMRARELANLGDEVVLYINTDDALVRRDLPHIVRSSTTLALRFKAPDGVEANDIGIVEKGGAEGSRFGNMIKWPMFRFRTWALWSFVTYSSVMVGAKLADAAMFSYNRFQYRQGVTSSMSANVASTLSLMGLVFTLGAGSKAAIKTAQEKFGGVLGNAANYFWSRQSMEYARRQERNNSMLPLVANFCTMIYTASQRSGQKAKMLKGAYLEHLQELTGSPVLASIDAANATMKEYKKSLDDHQEYFHSVESTSVVYNIHTFKRFTFYEYYQHDKTTVNLMSELAEKRPIHRSSSWNSVPNGNAMRLFPPSDVAAALFEAEELRGLPLTATAKFTAGSPSKLNASTPAELAGKAAFRELLQIVLRARRSLRGEHLMISATQMAMELATKGSALLTLAYGASAGATLVDGDDILWTCARGGTATRLAVRHMSLFEEAEAFRFQNDGQAISEGSRKQTLNFWHRPRRVIMESFAKAWQSEAAAASKERGEELPRAPPLKQLASEAVCMYARTMALISNKPNATRGEIAVAVSVVTSSLAHAIYVASPAEDALATRTLEYIDSREQAALAFIDQADFKRPKPHATQALITASWASRRIDTVISRDFELGDNDTNGAKVIINMLSSPSIRKEAPRTYYYCPMGGMIQATPPRTPFAIDALGSRLVWLHALELSAMRVADAIRAEDLDDPEDGVVVKCTRLDQARQNNVTGFSRHPLALTMRATAIEVMLSDTPTADGVGDLKDEGSKTLRDALERMQKNPVDANATRSRVQRTRAIAYNSERLLNAASLAGMAGQPASKLCVKLSSATDTLSLSIALAMQSTESGSEPSELVVHVRDVPDGRHIAKRLSEQAHRAYVTGCKVCSLAEVALCV